MHVRTIVPIAECRAAKVAEGAPGLRVGKHPQGWWESWDIGRADVTVLWLTVRIPWPFVYLDFLGSVVILSQFRYEPRTHLFSALARRPPMPLSR